jgi:hypothetical protein
MSDQKLRMNAYYFSFEETGVRAVDEVLSAVATAGKCFHHTNQWSDSDKYQPVSCADEIQNAANRSADKIRALESENNSLLDQLATKIEEVAALKAGGEVLAEARLNGWTTPAEFDDYMMAKKSSIVIYSLPVETSDGITVEVARSLKDG